MSAAAQRSTRTSRAADGEGADHAPEDAVLLAVAGNGGTVTVAMLRRQFPGVPDRTLRRWLSKLVDKGALHRVRRGEYSGSDEGRPLNAEGAEIVAAIEGSEADAHLTGHDVLASYAHQFVYDFPHLVYCHPSHADGLAQALASAGFLVVPAGPRLFLPQADRIVVLRKQAHAAGRYPVRGSVASPEKAWVDLVRETRRSRLPFDFGELGRILRAMEDAGLSMTTLRAYARRVGYQQWVSVSLGEATAEGQAQAELAAGYAA